MDGEKEYFPVFSFFGGADHNAAQTVVSYGDLLLLGKAFYFGEDIAGVKNVNRKDAIVKTYDEGEGEIFGKPSEGVQNVWVDQKIINRAEKRPKSRKKRAYYTVNVSPLV